MAAALFVPLPDYRGVDGGPILFINGFTFSFFLIFPGVHMLRRARALRRGAL